MLRHPARVSLVLSIAALLLGCSGLELPEGFPELPGEETQEDAVPEDSGEAAEEREEEAEEAAEDSGEAVDEAEEDREDLPPAFAGWPVPLPGGELVEAAPRRLVIAHESGTPVDTLKRYTRELRQAGGWRPVERDPDNHRVVLESGGEQLRLGWNDPDAEGRYELVFELL